MGVLLSTRYGGKHGDWSGNASTTANSVHYLMEVRAAVRRRNISVRVRTAKPDAVIQEPAHECGGEDGMHPREEEGSFRPLRARH